MHMQTYTTKNTQIFLSMYICTCTHLLHPHTQIAICTIYTKGDEARSRIAFILVHVAKNDLAGGTSSPPPLVLHHLHFAPFRKLSVGRLLFWN